MNNKSNFNNNTSPNRKKNLEPPKDTSLRFFAYGVFKKGEIAYHKIAEYVNKSEEFILDNCKLMEKDGMAILFPTENSKNKVKGTLLSFKAEKCKDAYRTISEFEPAIVYEWNTVTLDSDEKINVLISSKKDIKGCDSIESETGEMNEWSSSKDSLFNCGMAYLYKYYVHYSQNVCTTLNAPLFSSYDNTKSFWDNYFELHSAYIFLYSILNRFCNFYNMNTDSSKEFSNTFSGCIQTQLFPNKKNQYNCIKDRVVCAINDENSYPQKDEAHCNRLTRHLRLIRNNVVHRGKGSGVNDFNLVRHAFLDLYYVLYKSLQSIYGENYLKDVTSLSEIEDLYADSLKLLNNSSK